MDFWISDWISGFHSGFLDFSLDFWISGFQFGFLQTVYEISFVTDPSPPWLRRSSLGTRPSKPDPRKIEKEGLAHWPGSEEEGGRDHVIITIP